ncbi:MAG: hypothetical protein QOG44_3205 [Acidimicrobiaceae bacterium]|jgi:hypothetical protein|nr:hypothetical protein [Acidimicrobiaceae bacterium]
MILTHDLVQAARAHAGRQRCLAGQTLIEGGGEQVAVSGSSRHGMSG